MTDASPEAGQRLALGFLERAAARRASAPGPLQARQEALALAALRSSLGLGRPEAAE